jgi:NAD(P)-dependent dehydrogenase (short-subunit alcohol dehydrogenase family)
MKTAIVIGVGPERGLGAQLCKRFAAEGLKVIVAGRTQSALQAVVTGIEKTGGAAAPFVADATKESNNTPGKIIEMDADYFENAWRVVCFGGFLFGREAVRRMAPKRAGTLLFTGASASLRGRSGYGAFNSAKAGLRTLAQAMAKEYASEGIHVAHVVVDGAIAGDKIFSRFPDAASREDSLIEIEGIVDAFEFLYRQPVRAWSFELDVRTSKEKW